MAIHEHEARVVVIESQGDSALVGCYTFGSSFDLDSFKCLEVPLSNSVRAGEQYNEAAEHDLPLDARVG